MAASRSALELQRRRLVGSSGAVHSVFAELARLVADRSGDDVEHLRLGVALLGSAEVTLRAAAWHVLEAERGLAFAAWMP